MQTEFNTKNVLDEKTTFFPARVVLKTEQLNTTHL